MEKAGQPSLAPWITVGANHEAVAALVESGSRGKLPTMQSQSGPQPTQNPQPPAVVEHVSGAHELLNALRRRIGEHPELAEAITKLETALSLLTVQTGGML